MELTIYAAWLNDVFALFDSFVLGLHHELALAFGNYLTPAANVLGAAGHWGMLFAGIAVLLLFFRKTRMAGVAMLVALAIAGGLSELVVKDLVDRPRPFLMSDTYNAWWQFVGSPYAHGSSFPSGHVAGCTAAMIALAYAARRWWVSLLGVLTIVAMAMDRMYLVVHYPSDVLAGFVLGFVCGVIGYAIVQGIWRLMGKHPDQLADAKVAVSDHARDVAIPRGARGEARMAEARANRTPAAWAESGEDRGAAGPWDAAGAPGDAESSSEVNRVITPSSIAKAAGAARTVGPDGTQRLPKSIEDLRL